MPRILTGKTQEITAVQAASLGVDLTAADSARIPELTRFGVSPGSAQLVGTVRLTGRQAVRNMLVKIRTVGSGEFRNALLTLPSTPDAEVIDVAKDIGLLPSGFTGGPGTDKAPTGVTGKLITPLPGRGHPEDTEDAKIENPVTKSQIPATRTGFGSGVPHTAGNMATARDIGLKLGILDDSRDIVVYSNVFMRYEITSPAPEGTPGRNAFGFAPVWAINVATREARRIEGGETLGGIESAKGLPPTVPQPTPPPIPADRPRLGDPDPPAPTPVPSTPGGPQLGGPSAARVPVSESGDPLPGLVIAAAAVAAFFIVGG